MTLDDDAGQGDGSLHLVSELLGSASDDANILWSMDPDGLPRHSPKDANLDDVAAASTIADAFRRWHANTNGLIDLLDASGLVILKMTIASDNQSVTMTTTEKFRNGF